jgi:hypothetical protein
MTDEVSVKVPVEFREPIVNMEDALRNFLEAGRKLSEVWDNDKVKKYPKYLPSFDEFLSDFAGILDEKNE